jgi:hypothetical protein
VGHERDVEHRVAEDSSSEFVGVLPDGVACQEASVAASTHGNPLLIHASLIYLQLQCCHTIRNVHLRIVAKRLQRCKDKYSMVLCSGPPTPRWSLLSLNQGLCVYVVTVFGDSWMISM